MKPGGIIIFDVFPPRGYLPIGGHLLVAGLTAVSGDPAREQRVCFRSPDAFVVVDAPARLEGHVNVTTCQAALGYVRLFTSPATAKSMPQPWWLEVVPRSRANRRLFIGRRDLAHARSSGAWRSGLYGILSRADWRASGLQRARVRRQGGLFVVTRSLFSVTAAAQATSRVQVVAESVTTDGRVTREVVRELDLGDVRLRIRTQPPH